MNEGKSGDIWTQNKWGYFRLFYLFSHPVAEADNGNGGTDDDDGSLMVVRRAIV